MNSKITVAARIILGLIFFVFGLNKFLHFMPMPPMPEQAGQFMGGLSKAPYFFPLLAMCEVIAGSLLLVGRLVPLALLILAPIAVQILLFHVVLDPVTQGIVVAILIWICGLILAKAYWNRFRPLFQ